MPAWRHRRSSNPFPPGCEELGPFGARARRPSCRGERDDAARHRQMTSSARRRASPGRTASPWQRQEHRASVGFEVPSRGRQRPRAHCHPVRRDRDDDGGRRRPSRAVTRESFAPTNIMSRRRRRSASSGVDGRRARKSRARRDPERASPSSTGAARYRASAAAFAVVFSSSSPATLVLPCPFTHELAVESCSARPASETER